MASHTKKDDFCLECHWEAFHLDAKDPEEPLDTEAQVAQWKCSQEEHHAALPHCEVGENCPADEDCCDMDTCSVTCPSVCDGFVDCDELAGCSVSHCDETHCNETHCDSTDPVCFDEHCFGSGTHADGEHSLEALLALGSPLNLESSDLLAPATLPQAPGEQLKTGGLPAATGLVGSTDAFFAPFAPLPVSHCHSHSHQHFQCHDLPKDAHHAWYPMPTSVNPADVFHMMGVCPDLSTCHHQYHVQQVPDCSEHQKPTDDASNYTCFHINPNPNHNHSHSHSHSHAPHFHTHNATDTADMADQTATQEPTTSAHRKPCRTHVHRCRTHSHAHHHYSPYSPYSRHSRSSVSSQISPGDTPPPLDGGSSVLTSPEYIPEIESHICRWTTTVGGVKKACGLTFSDSCGLQEHLIASHMATVEGAKGTGYYCCWEGCHRPDEPFSQKSKLQGHFLTHSNYKNFKCSVCGKFFARQATLERHERSHRGEKPYKCAECGKSFTDSSELKTHSRTHTGEKPFKCTYPGCNFQTGDSSNMSSHRLTHGERRHKCHYPGCTKSFTRHDQLKRHLKSTHKDHSSSITMPSPLTDQFGSVLAEVA
ncbi:C2H2-type zinc finger protein [Aspergillus saccharolyticus JOP 1030-1]|uniref:C2H2-type domain-containing protein n=1 Tax=Aspergillus saccharolyticus JOP 1030-1 TaxID=1450539 RepID=A0A318ZF77_9EURO|nr:hypothetical protein BP01DRAFT_294509 [Aspergillus saccharolyticus JOP 1030-1]PYH46201.1 hypothetical protein BP01DRAFT_294509 [Aspergillus saccharolyticus JOP 1030-1]